MMIVVDGQCITGTVEEIYHLLTLMKPSVTTTGTEIVNVPSCWVVPSRYVYDEFGNLVPEVPSSIKKGKKK